MGEAVDSTVNVDGFFDNNFYLANDCVLQSVKMAWFIVFVKMPVSCVNKFLSEFCQPMAALPSGGNAFLPVLIDTDGSAGTARLLPRAP